MIVLCILAETIIRPSDLTVDMPDRRKFLAMCGLTATLTLSGCQGSSEREEGDSGDQTTPHTTATTVRKTSTQALPEGIILDDVRVRKALIYDFAVGKDEVKVDDDKQYVLANVRAENGATSNEFVFKTDGRSWSSHLVKEALDDESLPGYHKPVNPISPTSRFTLEFKLPSPLTVTNPRIQSTVAETPSIDQKVWTLSEANQERLAAQPPKFELIDLTVPDSVSHDETVSVSMTVSNTSNTDGHFLAMIVWPTFRADDDESINVRQFIAGDETKTITNDFGIEGSRLESNPTPLQIRGHVNAEREVTVRNYSTPG